MILRGALTGTCAAFLAATVGACSGGGGPAPSPTNDRPTTSAGRAARTTVTCRADSSADAQADVPGVERLAGSLAPHPRVRADGSHVIVEFTRTVPTASAARLCASHRVDFRGLIAPPVDVQCTSDCTGRTEAALTDLPTSERAYSELSAPRRDAIDTALQNVRCRFDDDESDATVVACGAGSDSGTLAYLAGPAIVTGSQVASARASSPTVQVVDWSVTVALDDAGTQAFAAWTRAHNSANQTGPGPQDCFSNSTVTCSDFVALVVDGRVVSAPVTTAPITGGRVSISGGFDGRSARHLAAAVRSGTLPAPLRLVSITHH